MFYFLHPHLRNGTQLEIYKMKLYFFLLFLFLSHQDVQQK